MKSTIEPIPCRLGSIKGTKGELVFWAFWIENSKIAKWSGYHFAIRFGHGEELLHKDLEQKGVTPEQLVAYVTEHEEEIFKGIFPDRNRRQYCFRIDMLDDTTRKNRVRFAWTPHGIMDDLWDGVITIPPEFDRNALSHDFSADANSFGSKD